MHLNGITETAMSESDQLQHAIARLQRLAEERHLDCVSLRDERQAPTLATGDAHFIHLIDADTAALHCPVQQKILLMDVSPAIYFETDAYIGEPIVLIHLDQIDDEELALRLEDACRFRSPAP
ncbi:MAG: hypothetical protein BGO80_03230 [Devosia sp. 63-57]|nr:MAG: hypothetical protein ABS74_04230 [Pelagibacterium sp. SCN 63-126]ODU87392.1 MAG: hypothetical protein ABT14_05320 [Pelagibacterium sp. SCN 63-17]OJX44884.1 MAG: hypothetical protein BGO80_03230 [Devosia sp. 63-57]